jgi:hypothetical protein
MYNFPLLLQTLNVAISPCEALISLTPTTKKRAANCLTQQGQPPSCCNDVKRNSSHRDKLPKNYQGLQHTSTVSSWEHGKPRSQKQKTPGTQKVKQKKELETEQNDKPAIWLQRDAHAPDAFAEG